MNMVSWRSASSRVTLILAAEGQLSGSDVSTRHGLTTQSVHILRPDRLRGTQHQTHRDTLHQPYEIQRMDDREVPHQLLDRRGSVQIGREVLPDWRLDS